MYVSGRVDIFDMVDIDLFTVVVLNMMVLKLGYTGKSEPMFYNYLKPLTSLDEGLYALACEEDVRCLGTLVRSFKLIEEPVCESVTPSSLPQHDSSTPCKDPVCESITHRCMPDCILTPPTDESVITYTQLSGVQGVDTQSHFRAKSFGVDDMDLNLNEPVNLNVSQVETQSKLLVSEEPDVGRTHEPILSEVSTQEPIAVEVSNEGNGQKDESTPTDRQFFYDDERKDTAYETEYDVKYSEDAGTDDDDDVDEDFLVDEENEIVEPDVDVHLFGISMDLPFDNIGITNLVPDDVLEGEDVDVINADGFDNDPGNDEEKNYRKRRLAELRTEMEGVINASGQWKYSFYTGQKFTTPKEAKDRVYLHSIKRKRNLKLYKNDGVRIRARCDGKVLVFTMSQGTRPTGPNRRIEIGPSGSSGPTTRSKKRKNTGTNDDVQASPSFLNAHDKGDLCPWVLINSDIPVKAVQDQLQRELEVQISMSKAFKAKAKAEREIKGDHVLQYSMLRDYVIELQSTNPNTTVKIAVERNIDPSLPTRVFQRIYICLGALKLGFRACRRDLLGLDGAFMKGSFPGQVLVAVGLDSNNRIYPLAYALVEAESKSSWCWFLQCLGDDINLHLISNFTFISDRQKRAASATNVRDFKKCRAKSDLLLNNICVVFNGKIVGGRDKPVITLLEYIREYCIKRIVNVQGVIDKCIGPLTPTATRIMESIKKEAHLMKVQWNGANKYQVSGSLGDQCVVDVVSMTCSCRKWELTGIPCKHDVAACWNMALNDRAAPPPETWVNPCYWLSTWKETYSHKIQPICGTKYWEKSTCPTTLLPPKHHVQVGRPRKKRKRSKHKDEPFVKDGQGRKATTGGNNAEASGSASGQAQQTEPAVGQDGSGGSGAGAVIGLSAAAGEGGAGVASQGSSRSRWTKRRVQTERISPQKRTPTQPASQPSTSSQVPVSETRNADGREMGDGVPTQSSAAGGASEWSFLIGDYTRKVLGGGGYLKDYARIVTGTDDGGLGGGDLRDYVRVVGGTDDGGYPRMKKGKGTNVMKDTVSQKNVCEEEVPLNNNIGKQIGDFVDMPSEAVEQSMDANVPDEIDGAKGEQVPNHVVKKDNLEFLVCKEVANPSVNELVDKGRPLNRKRVYAE
ncbi:heat stress transcription factor B-4-like protein [Tanacetum coccineum]